MKISDYLIESGIRIPKDTKAAKINFHSDMDGIFSAILVYRQLSKQGIDPRNISVSPVQYGQANKNQFETKKGKMVVLVDFARLPEGSRRPDFWSDHHQLTDKDIKAKAGGKTGATEYPSESEHLATIYASGLADSTTINAISIIDSANYSHLEDVMDLPKNFKEAGRMERLAIITNALLVSTRLLDNRAAISNIIRTTNPSLVALYNNILKHVRLTDLQKEGIAELQKETPDWNKVEEIRNRMPTMGMKKKIVKEDTYRPTTSGTSAAYMGGQHIEQEKKKHRKPKVDKHPEKITKTKKQPNNYPVRSETTPNRGDYVMGENYYVDDEMKDDLDKGTKKSLARYRKRNKSASTTKIKKRSMVIPASDSHTIDIDHSKVNEATLESTKELEALQKEWDNLAQQGKDMKDVAPEKWARLKALTNEHRDKIVDTRKEQIETQTTPGKTKFTKVGDKGIIIKQNPLGGGSVERFMGNLLTKQGGGRYPFMFRRYPTFFQVNVNPDLPEEVKKKIDLGEVGQEVLKEMAKRFETKYNKWSFDIIRKESGGHAGITNVSGLGTLGLTPQNLTNNTMVERVFTDLEIDKKIVNALKRAKWEEGDIVRFIDKAKREVEQLTKSRDAMKQIDALDKRLKKLKTIKTTLKEVMPVKWVMSQFLDKIKDIFSRERNKIMDEMEDEFKNILEGKFANLKVTKPISSAERFRAKRPDTQKEIITRLAK